jgi:hypothetical protein
LSETIFRTVKFRPRIWAIVRKAAVTAIDREYYARRAREEREREKAASDRATAQVHAEMAEEYERLLKSAEGDPKP